MASFKHIDLRTAGITAELLSFKTNFNSSCPYIPEIASRLCYKHKTVASRLCKVNYRLIVNGKTGEMLLHQPDVLTSYVSVASMAKAANPNAQMKGGHHQRLGNPKGHILNAISQ